jgi:endonuclease-3
MQKKQRYQAVIEYFGKAMPNPETELLYNNDFQLLVAVMLSAQCTDKRVNMVTPGLFRQFPDANALAKASEADVFKLIRSISYPNSKAKHLVATANIIVETMGGQVPLSVEQLISLPGVGRKTANVITSVLDQQPNMAVDTHVFRVSKRLGLVPQKATLLGTEKELLKHIPAELIHKAHHWLILHGRYVCKARNPDCAACGLTLACRYFSKKQNIT